MTKFDNFKEAFMTGCSGSLRECECGKVYYNLNGNWDWEEGELEELEESNAIILYYPVATLIINGTEYVTECDCWHEMAKKFIDLMERCKYGFVKYLQLEKKRKQEEFQDALNPPDDIIYQYGKNAWKSIDEAPKGEIVEVMLPDEKTIVEAHWASDLSGEEQPPFEGWFTKCGEKSYSQIKKPIAWRVINECSRL